jgi:hypothetical protein
MLNEINGAAGLASHLAPSLRLNCLSPPKWLVFFEGVKDELGYKSFFWKAEHEMKPDAVGSHVRSIRRREAKVNWM